jgi:hypothetical protein
MKLFHLLSHMDRQIPGWVMSKVSRFLGAVADKTES